MRFQIISPLLGPVESYRDIKYAIAALDSYFETSENMSDKYILDTKTGKPLTRKQVEKWR